MPFIKVTPRGTDSVRAANTNQIAAVIERPDKAHHGTAILFAGGERLEAAETPAELLGRIDLNLYNSSRFETIEGGEAVVFPFHVVSVSPGQGNDMVADIHFVGSKVSVRSRVADILAGMIERRPA